MATCKLTDLEIAARIVPTMLRWPPPEIARTITWDRLREPVDLLRIMMRTVDDACLQAEADGDLSPDGIARRRQKIGRQALSELENWSPLRAAERAVTENIEYLEKRMVDLPQPPTAVADVMLAQEIRQYIRSHKSPIDVALKSMSDPRMLSAILNAPAFLSGLSDTQMTLIRERARTALHPQQVQMQQELAKSLDDLRGGVEAAKRMVRERCQVGEDKASNSDALVGAKSAAA
jgi:hypothetical protein